jgi:hypothetical protein
MIWWILVGVLSLITVGLAGILIWVLVQLSHMFDGF